MKIEKNIVYYRILSHAKDFAKEHADEEIHYDETKDRFITSDKRSLSLVDLFREEKSLDFKMAYKQLSEKYVPDHDDSTAEIMSAYVENSHLYLINNPMVGTKFDSFADIARKIHTPYAKLGYDPYFVNTETGDTNPVFVLPVADDSVVLYDMDGNANCVGKNNDFYSAFFEGHESTQDAVFIVESDADAIAALKCGVNAVPYRSTEAFKQYLISKRLNTSLAIALTDRDHMEDMRSMLKSISRNAYFIEELCGHPSIHDLFSSNQELVVNLFNKWRDPSRYYTMMTESQYGHLTEFKRTIERFAQQEPISTGWEKLDENLQGGLYPFLYILGGRTGSGKTAFALQMADYIASQGQPVLYVSLEIGRSELYARSLTRTVFKQAGLIINKVSRINEISIQYQNRANTLTLEDNLRIGKAEEEYAEVTAKNMFVIESVVNTTIKEIEDELKRYTSALHQAPVLFVDYLQGIKKTDSHMSDKENIDRNIHALKAFARDYQIPVICLTSNNRSSYTSDKNIEASSSGSGQIEYTADFLFSWQPEHTDLSYEEWRKSRIGKDRNMDLVFLKNRHGEAYISVPFKYLPNFQYVSVDKEKCNTIDSAHGTAE